MINFNNLALSEYKVQDNFSIKEALKENMPRYTLVNQTEKLEPWP